MDVLVFVRHPAGGIRTYISYVYGSSGLHIDNLYVLSPEAHQLKGILEPIPAFRKHIQAESNIRSLLQVLWEALRARRPDILHSHGFTAGVLAAAPARLLGIRHIVTTHDVFLDGQFSGISGLLRKFLIGRFLSMATVINPVGEDAANNLVDTYPHLAKKEKVVPIRNGIAVERFQTNEVRDVRGEGAVPEQALLVGFFGRFMAQKGFGTLVNAVEQWNRDSDSRPLHVACFGWGGFIREEQASLRSRGLEDFFHFFSSTDEMGAALRGVDAVVMPSKWEACPLLPMEAMVAGVPVIASDCIGLREVTKNTPALMFSKGSDVELLSQLRHFDRESNLIKTTAKNFRKEAAQRFSVDSTAAALQSLYSRLLRRSYRESDRVV